MTERMALMIKEKHWETSDLRQYLNFNPEVGSYFYRNPNFPCSSYASYAYMRPCLTKG